MTDPTFHETLQLDDGTEVTVKFTQGPYYPAVVSGPSDNWCPAEGGEIDIVDVLDDAGVTVTVPDATRQRFYDEIHRMEPHEQVSDPDILMEEQREALEIQRDWAGDDW